MRLPLIGVLFCQLLAVGSPCSAKALLIRDVTVISPEREAPLMHADVLVRAGRIAEISAAPLAVTEAQILDGQGRYLIPGLIDSHVHLDHATGLKRRYTADFDRLRADFMVQQPRSFLYFGYTTLVENNGDPEVDRDFDSAPLHPRREFCGALPVFDDFLATDFDAHADFLAAYPNFLHDRFRNAQLPPDIDPAAHTAEATVARIAATGARCVKLYFEEALWWPGEAPPSFQLPSEAILRDVVAAAHARGLVVLMHGNTTAAHRMGLKVGVDVMAHGLWDWAGATQGRDTVPDDVVATADAVAASAMRVQPTWMAMAGMQSLFNQDRLADKHLARVLPAPYLTYLRGPAQQARIDYLKRFGPAITAAYASGEAATDQPAEIMAVYLERYRRILQRQHAAGAKFVFGTDTAVGTPGWGNPPGLSGYREMEAWVAAGIDLQTVLRAATLDNARAFGLDQELGSIEVGKRADLLLLAANPLVAVSAYDHIEQVILGGAVIERDALAADAPTPVGIDTLEVPSKDAAPGFTATLWYHALPGPEIRFGASRIRSGYLAVDRGRPALSKSVPLIVLTHGTGGSAQSMAWLAMPLARRGALVVAADHPASSGGDPERQSMMAVWTQPNDVHHLIDTLLASEWGVHIDRQKIVSVGFSLGGATAMMLAGSRLDFERFPTFCETHEDGACRAFAKHFSQVDARFYERANADHKEPRLSAAVAIAPGFTEAFTAASLHAQETPLLLITGSRDQQLPPATHVAPMRDLLPKQSRYLEIEDAHHFSFLPQCSDGAETVLAETDEQFVCQEFGQKTRAEIHAEVMRAITTFLTDLHVL